MDCLVSPTTRSVQVMRIPVLMFDFGNVVGFFDYSTVFQRLGLKLGLSAEQFEAMMYERGAARLGLEFESGRLTAEEFARQVTELAGLEMSFEEFEVHWPDIFIGDALPNVEGARASGLQAVHYHDTPIL